MPRGFEPELLERARRSLRRRDPVLGAVIRRVGPCRIQPRGAPYRSLLRAILFQQVAGAAARAIEARLQAHFGGRYPTAAVLAAASDRELRAVGLSRQKIAAFRAVAEAFDSRAVSDRRLARMDDEDVVEAVTRIRGVGPWTAHMLLMFSLARPDVLPVGDYGVRKGVRDLYGLEELPSAAELEGVALRWRPYRTIASWYVWRHLDPVSGGG